MDTEKLRVFLAVLSAGTISGAAENLGYTTSGVSRLIASLEQEAGVPLLRRSHSGVEPTEACSVLLPVMDELVRSAERYRQLTYQLRGLDIGSITVGAQYNGYYRPLSELIAEFTRSRPGIEASFVEGTSTYLASMVATGHADFCIISKREGAFRWLELGRDELVALVSRGHPAVQRGYYLPRDFESDPFIELYPASETDNSRYFAEYGITPNTRFTTYDTTVCVSMVDAGLGVALVNNLLAQSLDGDFATLPLSPAKYVEIGIAVPKKEAITPAGANFLSLAIQRLRTFDDKPLGEIKNN